MERTNPWRGRWWRKALKIAWDGVRTGFGLFPRASKTEPADETASIEEEEVFLERPETEQEVESALKEHSPSNETETAPMESAAAETRAEETVAAAETAVEAHAEQAAESVAPTEPAATEPEVAAEASPEQVQEHAAEVAEAEVEAPEAQAEVLVKEHAAEVEAEVPAEAANDVEAGQETAATEPEVVAEAAPAEAEAPELDAVEAEAEPEAEAAGESVATEPAEVLAEAAAVPSEEAAAEPDDEAAPDAAAEPAPVAETEPEAPETIEEADAEAGVAVIEAIADEPEVHAEIVLEADPDVTSYETAAQAALAEDAEAQPETVAAIGAEDESTDTSAAADANASAAAVGSATAADGGVVATAAIDAAPAAAEPRAAAAAPAQPVKRLIKLEAQGDNASPFSVLVEEVYDGPLDLLLDLIRKQDIDIYDIPIARITAQFLAYVNQLRANDVDVAGEFIYTASLLIHIKSKMLLPRTTTGPEEVAEDPRRELVERLLEHERFKNAAQMLQQKQMLEAASWTNPGVREFRDDAAAEPEIAADTVDLVRVFRDILERARNRPVLDVQEDAVTVGQMVQFLARRLTMEDKPIALRRLLSHTHSERALIAMFLALLEMVRLQAILLRQDLAFSEIFIKKHTGFEAAMNQGLANAQDDWR